MIEIKETLNEHLPYLWEIIEEHGTGKFFPDNSHPKTLKGFIAWWKINVTGMSLTGLLDGIPVGVGYLHSVYRGYTASICIWKKKGLYSSSLVAEIMNSAITRLYDSAELHKITGIVRTDNKACLRLLKLIGFKVDGKIRHHNKVGGKWQDYYLVSMLRSEWKEKYWKRSLMLWVVQKKVQLMRLPLKRLHLTKTATR